MGLPQRHRDDFISAGLLGLVEAAGRFDAGRGSDFRAFAFLRIRGAVIDHIRASCEISGYAYQVLKALESAQELRTQSLEERRAVAKEALSRVGLVEAMDKRPDELSGGMRQRVAVARALAMRPKVLLMDEPFAALDVQTRAKMQDFLLDVWRDSGASVLFVTHHIDEAVALADRVVVFTARPGRIKTLIPIDLPRPRNPFSPECEKLRMQLTEEMRSEVDRAFAEQEALVPA
jgi:ABC-type nitrate/sulfonate/bicarbonate transport system ATPase subunit